MFEGMFACVNGVFGWQICLTNGLKGVRHRFESMNEVCGWQTGLTNGLKGV